MDLLWFLKGVGRHKAQQSKQSKAKQRNEHSVPKRAQGNHLEDLHMRKTPTSKMVSSELAGAKPIGGQRRAENKAPHTMPILGDDYFIRHGRNPLWDFVEKTNHGVLNKRRRLHPKRCPRQGIHRQGRPFFFAFPSPMFPAYCGWL